MNQLVVGLYVSFRTLTWAVILAGLVLFVGAVFMTEVVGKETEQFSADTRSSWKSLSTSTNNLILLATASNWMEIIEPVKNNSKTWWTLIPLGVFFVVIALGLFNMIIGVMVYTALNLEELSRRRNQAQRLFNHRVALLQLKKIMSAVNNRPVLRSPHYMGVLEFEQLSRDSPSIHRCLKQLETTTEGAMGLTELCGDQVNLPPTRERNSSWTPFPCWREVNLPPTRERNSSWTQDHA